jgi:hypothetical protein
MNIACIDFHSSPLHIYLDTLDDSHLFTIIINAYCELLTWITCLQNQPTLNASRSLDYIITHLEFFFFQSFVFFATTTATTTTTTTQHRSHVCAQHTQSPPLSLIYPLPPSAHTEQRNESPRQSNSSRPDRLTQDQQDVTTIEGPVRPY